MADVAINISGMVATINASPRDEAAIRALIALPNMTTVRRRCAIVILLYAGHPEAAARLAAADDDAETLAERGAVWGELAQALNDRLHDRELLRRADEDVGKATIIAQFEIDHPPRAQ